MGKIINKIIKIVGSGNPKFGGIPYKSFENMDLYADITKAKLLIQWSPEFNIDEGLRKTINFYNENLTNYSTLSYGCRKSTVDIKYKRSKKEDNTETNNKNQNYEKIFPFAVFRIDLLSD